MKTNDDATPVQMLEACIDSATTKQLATFIGELPASELAHAVSRLNDENQTALLTKLTPTDAAALIDDLPEVEVVDMLGKLEAGEAAAIVHELASDEQADVINDLPTACAEAIIAELPEDSARRVAALSEYSNDVAGGIMITEYLSYGEESTVADVIDDLRANAEIYQDYEVQYAYVTSQSGQLRGVLRLRDLLLATPQKRIRDQMILRPMNVNVTATLDQLDEFFESHGYFAVPVTDAAQKLVGVVRCVAVEEALGAQSERDFRRSQGIIEEELRTMPLFVRSRRRLAWLSVNVVLNLCAASVIAMYQETLTQVIALAVFLPIISDMSGCSGNQAVAVSMRELTLGVLKPTELLRVWFKEVSVGIVNGLALGILIGVIAFAWKGTPYLGLVVGIAMTLNTMLAVTLGGSIPLLLKQLGVDPALAAGPILTTITDVCGFFLVLSLASAFLPLLLATAGN